MKSIIIFIAALLLTATNYAQLTEPANPSPSEMRNNYLKKSKNQKKAAWIILGTGAVVFTTGMIVFPEDWDWLFGTTPEKDDEANLAGVLIFVGGITSLCSIPLFIASGKNNRRANNITAYIKMETSTSIQKNTFAKNSYPAFSLKLSLK